MKPTNPKKLAERLERHLASKSVSCAEAANMFINDIEMDMILNGDGGKIDTMLAALPQFPHELSRQLSITSRNQTKQCFAAMH